VGFWPNLKPDVFNRTRKTFLEIKPFSPSGIVGGYAQVLTYELFFAFAGFVPDIAWQPEPMVLEDIPEFGYPIAVFNVGGVLFYTDMIDNIKDFSAITALDTALLLRKFRAAQATAAFISAADELAVATRLGSTAIAANSARLQGATLLSTLNAVAFGVVF
jgi:hypothetical protein